MQQQYPCYFSLAAAAALIANTGVAGESTPPLLSEPDAAAVDAPAIDLWTGEGASLGGIVFPHVHLLAALGTSTSDAIAEELSVGHHDPNREGFTVQAIELGASLQFGEYIEGFATYGAVIDLDDEWSGAWEEAFLKAVNLPGGFELRGGRYFNRFGFYNAVHPHGYFFVDKDLLEGRMLGEDGIATEGGEITWRLPTPFTSALSYSFGKAVTEAHDHAHGHGEEGEEPEFEAEGAAFADELHSLHLIAKWDYNDFHQYTGHLSAAWGDNAFGEDTGAYTAGVEYLWRENGYERGGRHLRWRTAVMLRDIDAVSGHLPGESEESEHEEHGHEHDEHGHAEEHEHGDHDHEHEHEHEEHEDGRRGSLSEWGVSSSLHYGWNESWEAGVGVAWVEGIGGAGVDERLRVSPAITWNPLANTQLRLQYNYDLIGGSQSEHSVWLGFGFNWGGREVR